MVIGKNGEDVTDILRRLIHDTWPEPTEADDDDVYMFIYRFEIELKQAGLTVVREPE